MKRAGDGSGRAPAQAASAIAATFRGAPNAHTEICRRQARVHLDDDGFRLREHQVDADVAAEPRDGFARADRLFARCPQQADDRSGVLPHDRRTASTDTPAIDHSRRQRHGAPAVGQERHAGRHAAHVALKDETPHAIGPPSYARQRGAAPAPWRGTLRSQPAPRAGLTTSGYPSSRAALLSPAFQSSRRTGRSRAFSDGARRAAPEDAEERPCRRRDGSRPIRNRGGASFCSTRRGQALEAAIRLGRDQPDGVNRRRSAHRDACREFFHGPATTSTPAGADSGKRGSMVVTIWWPSIAARSATNAVSIAEPSRASEAGTSRPASPPPLKNSCTRIRTEWNILAHTYETNSHSRYPAVHRRATAQPLSTARWRDVRRPGLHGWIRCPGHGLRRALR